MVHRLLAIFIALLIGNPICLCAMTNVLTAESEGAPRVTCCCSAADPLDDEQESPEEPNSEQPSSCLCCLGDESQAALEIQVGLSKNSGKDFDTCERADYSYFLPRSSLLKSSISKWPPGSLLIFSVSERLALYSYYLL